LSTRYNSYHRRAGTSDQAADADPLDFPADGAALLRALILRLRSKWYQE
jgi:hypothetical protein